MLNAARGSTEVSQHQYHLWSFLVSTVYISSPCTSLELSAPECPSNLNQEELNAKHGNRSDYGTNEPEISQ